MLRTSPPLHVWQAYARLDGLAANATPVSELTAQVGLGRMYQLFGEEMEALMDELNRALVA
jgi:hypothetical protein